MSSSISTTTTTAPSSVTTGQLLDNKPTGTTTLNSRRKLWRLGRKKKLPTVRLGGQTQSPGRGSGSVMVRLIRRIRIRWLKLKKAGVLKKLKEYYLCVLKDLTEHDKALEKHHQLLLMETSFAVPVMGIPINSFR